MSYKSDLLRLFDCAHELIRDKERWTTNAYARRPDEKSLIPTIATDALDPEATCWCSLGALQKCQTSNEETELRVTAINYLADAATEMGYIDGIVTVNDTKGHEVTMQVWARARELINAQLSD